MWEIAHGKRTLHTGTGEAHTRYDYGSGERQGLGGWVWRLESLSSGLSQFSEILIAEGKLKLDESLNFTLDTFRRSS